MGDVVGTAEVPDVVAVDEIEDSTEDSTISTKSEVVLVLNSTLSIASDASPLFGQFCGDESLLGEFKLSFNSSNLLCEISFDE